MDVAFRDQLLTCRECGNQFVYTVGQQRITVEEQGELTSPDFCPVCEVKIARMGRRSDTIAHQPATTGHTNGGSPSYYPEPNGGRNGLARSGNGSGEHKEAELEAPDEFDDPVATQPSPNGNTPGYRSGTAHPLFGHEGEIQTGWVKWFNDRKGFGFITLDDGNDLFVHYSGIVSEGYKTLKQGQRVSLILEDTDKGPQASRVEVIETEQPVEELEHHS